MTKPFGYIWRGAQTGLILAFFICVGYITYWTVHDLMVAPVELKLVSFSSVIEQGEPISMSWDIKRNWANCRIEVYRYLTPAGSNDKIALGQTDNYIEKAERYQTDITVPVPPSIPPGNYNYNSESYYSCNIVHRLFGSFYVGSEPIPLRIDPVSEPEPTPSVENKKSVKREPVKVRRRAPANIFTRIIRTITKPLLP